MIRGKLPVRQKGAALLAMILVIVVGLSYILVSKFNKNAQHTSRIKQTYQSMSEAKYALISYALRYPEIDAQSGTDSINGPGYLPCPDISNDPDKFGQAGGNCSESAGTNIGRLPFETLELPELRDGDGVYLWYVVSGSHHSGSDKAELMNIAITANLKVENEEDIVAIIFAPGAPIENQNERSKFSNDEDQYIEYYIDNNTDFKRKYNSNDIVLKITRKELMTEIEKRVLGEVSNNLNDYYKDEGYYPWLAEEADADPAPGICTGYLSPTQDAPNITPWVFKNEWHKYLRIAFQKDESPPDDNCEELNSDFTVSRYGEKLPAKALAIAVGMNLVPDEDNEDLENGKFTKDSNVPGFDDQLRILN